MLNRLLEFLLGLDKGFFNSPGELGWRFDPHWPGPLIGQAGRWQNDVLGAVAIAMLLLLARKTAAVRLHRFRLAAAAFCAALVALLVVTFVGAAWWNLLLAAAVVGLIAYLWSTRRDVGLMALGRSAMALLLLMVISGPVAWNLSLGIGGLLLVMYVYQREGRSTGPRVFLGLLRGALIALVLVLLNNPIITRTTLLTEPSVVAILIDDSMSMGVRDVGEATKVAGPSRLEAAVSLLTAQDQALIRKLAEVHTLRFYSFDRNSKPLGTAAQGADSKASAPGRTPIDPGLLDALAKLKAEGTSTQVIPSILTALDDLQGQRLAGVVVLTDGRDTPTAPLAEAYKTLNNYGVKVYPVGVGSDQPPRNIELTSVSVQDSAFKDDIVNLKASVRAIGFEAGHPIKVRLTDKKTGALLRDPDGKPAEKTITPADSKPMEVELLFKPDQVGPLDIQVEAEKQPGEIDEQDNIRVAQVSVLDAKITVLYVEGYPRWEYRYIKNEMIRDKTVDISCILTSADPTFAQEHSDLKSRGEAEKFKYFPFNQFPTSLDQLMECDVVLFGDVDPRQFADAQLQMVADFVSKKGGGFGMIAGPQWSPAAYRNTPIEAVLPVSVLRAEAGWPAEPITEGFRPMLTREGQASSIFRFFSDPLATERYLKDQIQPLYWYSRGITAKPGVGEVYAEHPTDLGPDGRRAPLLVLGRFGAGRTLFSAYDDSWRWRFYTGESIFDTYWVQQLRYLARSKKLGQREITFTSDRTTYVNGEQVRLSLRVLNPALLQQLPPEIVVQMKDESGQLVRSEKLQREAGQNDYYSASFTADRAGRFTLTLPPIISDVSRLDLPLEVIVPRLELAEPQVDRTQLSHLAAQTGGQEVKYDEARRRLPELILSAARTVPLVFSRPLWDKPLAMVIFVLLLTSEWVLRKVFGMV